MHLTLLPLLTLPLLASAQFGNFFEGMFGGGGGGQQQQQRGQNVASDSQWYRDTHDGGLFPSIILFSLSLSLSFFPPFRSLHLASLSFFQLYFARVNGGS